MKHQHAMAVVTWRGIAARSDDRRCHRDHRSCSAGQLVSRPRWPPSLQVLTCHWPLLAPGGGRRRVGSTGWLNTAIVHDHQDVDAQRWEYGTQSYLLIYYALQPSAYVYTYVCCVLFL